MRKFGLIGYPLEHSFSKKYFTEKFSREHVVDCVYNNYPLADILQLPELISSDTDLEGLNVTIPYKSEVINYLDYINTEAGQVGAVNVLKIKRLKDSNLLYGFNSDIDGIRDTLIPVYSANLVNAIVLGTGGSSKAVCHVLKKINVKYTLISRNNKPGCLTYSDIGPELLNNTQLIVNTTPLGMYPDLESKPDIRYDLLNETHILFDLVYNPEMTGFLRTGKEQGCRILTGLRMLHSQAERSWEIWNDDTIF